MTQPALPEVGDPAFFLGPLAQQLRHKLEEILGGVSEVVVGRGRRDPLGGD